MNKLDDYKTVRRTNMDTYRKRLNTYKRKNENDDEIINTINIEHDEVTPPIKRITMERYRSKIQTFRKQQVNSTHSDEMDFGLKDGLDRHLRSTSQMIQRVPNARKMYLRKTTLCQTRLIMVNS